MALFEWLFEANNPNPVGEVKEREKPEYTDPINWLAILLGQVGFWLCVYFFLGFNKGIHSDFDYPWALIKMGFLTLYLLIGYFFDIRPDYDNVGILGGIIDHPFRYTDDLNRFLIFLKIIFYPGYIMALSFVELWKVWKRFALKS